MQLLGKKKRVNTSDNLTMVSPLAKNNAAMIGDQIFILPLKERREELCKGDTVILGNVCIHQKVIV